MREILDAIFYLVRTGCQWRLLPHEFPPWQTVYHWFRRWRLDGTWERVHAALRERLRVAGGPGPAAERRDHRQPVGQDHRRRRGARLRRGQEALRAQAPPPGRHAGAGAAGDGPHRRPPGPGRGAPAAGGRPEQFPRLGHVWVDQGYTGSGKAWIEEHLGWTVEVVQHPPKARGEWVPLGTGADPRPFEWRRLPPERTGFRGVLPRRWVVERTFSWLGQSRRLSKDYERLCATSEALIYVAMTRIMLRRLARA